jgi:DNA-binding NarL/FixJ family response regulator
MPEPLTVVIADDHAPTRVGVQASLEGRGFSVVAAVANADAAVEAALDARPDVCLRTASPPRPRSGAISRASRSSC